MIKDLVPPLVEEEEKEEKKREISLGGNVHTTCLEVREPDADDEVTGDREAYVASVLARYRKSLIERTKYHLGMQMQMQPFSHFRFPFYISRIINNFCWCLYMFVCLGLFELHKLTIVEMFFMHVQTY